MGWLHNDDGKDNADITGLPKYHKNGVKKRKNPQEREDKPCTYGIYEVEEQPPTTAHTQKKLGCKGGVTAWYDDTDTF